MKTNNSNKQSEEENKKIDRIERTNGMKMIEPNKQPTQSKSQIKEKANKTNKAKREDDEDNERMENRRGCEMVEITRDRVWNDRRRNEES